MSVTNWYWDKHVLENNTPSIEDGMDYATEVKFRKEGARFILSCGLQMFLGYNTLATGVVFFHRFYMFHSFQTFPPHVTAACCLYLAGKVEETPKRCKDIVKTAKALLSEKNFATFGDDPVEEVMAMERILLQTIKFDLKVSHPYNYLKKYIKCLKANKDQLQEVLQMAWNFVNDSLCTTLSIEWEPEIIAIAVIHLAGKLCKLKVINWTGRLPEHKHWWDMFVKDLNVKLLEDICHQILDLYSSDKDKQSANLFAEAAKSIGQKSSSPTESATPSKMPKIETQQPSIPDVSKVPAPAATSAASWAPMTGYPPSIAPSENTLHSTLPNLTVPPPNSFPMANLSVPPPTHIPFPPANLAVPPPPFNPGNYYGSEQYVRY